MRSLLSIFKNSLRTITAIIALIFVCVYVASRYNLTGYLAKQLLANDISEYLGTEVTVENADVDIFNQVVLEQLLVKDLESDTLLFARRAKVSFDLLPLLNNKLVVHSIQFIDFDINLSRKDSLSDTNFKFLVDILATPKSSKSSIEDIKVNSIFLRSGSISYDDYSQPRGNRYFDINHLQLDNISSNLKVSSSKADGLNIRIKRFTFDEKSGLSVAKASAMVNLDPQQKSLDIRNLVLSCSQDLHNGICVNLDFDGSASYTNQQLNAEVTNLTVDAPSMFGFKAECKVDDAFSHRQHISFDAQLRDFTVTRLGLNTIVSQYFRQYYDQLKEQIQRIERFSMDVSAKGDRESFAYSILSNAVGVTTADLKADGVFTKEQPYNCDLVANVGNLLYKSHEYQQIALDGKVNSSGFNGSVSVDDPLCMLNAYLVFDFINPSHFLKLKADIEQFSPYELNLTKVKNLDDISFSAKVMAEGKLGSLHYPVGFLNVDSLEMSKATDTYFLPYFSAEAKRLEDGYIACSSSELLDVIFIKQDSTIAIQGNISEERKLSQILNIPVAITKESDFHIEMNEDNRLIYAGINIPEALYGDNIISTMLSTIADGDSLIHNLSIDYKTQKHHLSSVLNASSTFSPLSLCINPCQILVNNDTVNCEGISIEKKDAKTYGLNKFGMRHKEQRVAAEGIISTEGRNNLSIHIENLGLDTLFNCLGKSYLMFGGIGTGEIVYSADSVNHIETKNLFIKDFSYLSGVLGDTHLDAFYDLGRGRIELDADILSLDDEHTGISGYVQLGKIDSLDLNFDASKLRARFLAHWLKGFLHDFDGVLTGNLHLFGPARRLNLTGKPYVDATFTNNLIGSRLNLRDTIYLTADEMLENGLIAMNNAKVYDKYQQMAYVNASIRHKNLLKYNYEVKIDMPNGNSGFLLFDKPSHYNNEMYWGQLFTSGTAVMRGADGKHRVDVSCKTVGKSQFNLSPGEESYSDNSYSFLTFRDKKKFEDSESLDYSDPKIQFEQQEEKSNSSTYIELSLQAQATENCQVYVQMDPLAEDRLICRGNGNISLHYDPRRDITIGGEYNITSGNYLITMRGDLMNKEFKIQNGSRVTFPGNFSNADLNINAIYSIPSVNLRDLDESFATMASMNRTTLPVDCKLNVTGQLSAPQIGFDIEVKNTSDDVQALVHNLIGTQEMRNREVLYLLLFNRFYTPEYASASQNNTGSQLSSFASSSLTSQLNNLLGHVSDNFTLGTNFRSDKGDFTDMEMDLSLTTRLWGDRLILNGNLGYRDPANRVGLHNNTNSFIGDFDVEFLINTSGTLRAKAYSHYNERDYSINNALTTQGIGFIARKDFKTIKELLFWKKISEKK